MLLPDDPLLLSTTSECTLNHFIQYKSEPFTGSQELAGKSWPTKENGALIVWTPNIDRFLGYVNFDPFAALSDAKS